MSDQGMVGADVVLLRTLAKTFVAASGTLTAQSAQVATQLGSVPWDGPDAQRYRGEWTATHSVSLRSVAAALEAAGKRLTAEADAQAWTSSDAPAGSVAAVGVGVGSLVAGRAEGEEEDDGLLSRVDDVRGWVTDSAEGLGTGAQELRKQALNFADKVRDDVADMRSWARHLAPGAEDLAHGDALRKLHVDPATLERIVKHADDAGRILKPVGWVADGYEGAAAQWGRDGGHDAPERALRAGAAGLATTGTEVIAAGLGGFAGGNVGQGVGLVVGATVGSLFPVVGTAFGATAGMAVGRTIGTFAGALAGSEALDRWGDELKTGVQEWSADRASDVIDVGEKAFDAGKDALGDAADVVSEGWKKVTFWN